VKKRTLFLVCFCFVSQLYAEEAQTKSEFLSVEKKKEQTPSNASSEPNRLSVSQQMNSPSIPSDLKKIEDVQKNEPTPSEIQENTGPMKAPETPEEIKREVHAPPSGAIGVEGAWDIYGWLSMLYWQPKQNGWEVGKVFAIDGNPSSVINQKFDFKPAFKVGIGVHFDYDDWVACMEYTHVAATDKVSHPIHTGASFQSFWMKNPTFTTHVESVWKMHLDLVDLMKARPFYVGQKVILQPSYGFRLFWLGQKIYEDCLIGENYQARGGTHSWAIGLRGGLNTQWMLEKGFRIFAHGAASLFYQRFHARVCLDDVDALPGVVKLFARQQEGRVNPSIEAASGCGYGFYFKEQKWHFDVLVSYEFHYFWHQNEIVNTIQDFQENVRAGSEGLSLQGLTLIARLDY
jgi:hypothetical protein